MRRRLFPVLFGGSVSSGQSYLFQDLFTSDDTAPITAPRTAEPGPGTLAIVDTGNKYSIDFKRLRFDVNAVANALSFCGGASVSRAAGLALTAYFYQYYRGGPFIPLAWSGNNTATLAGANFNGGFHFHSASSKLRIQGGKTPYTGVIYYHNSRLWIIARTTGSFMVAGNKLLYVDDVSNAADLYPMGIHQDSPSGEYEDLYILQLGAPWTTDTGIATDVKAAAIANDTLVHTADGHILATWTPQAAETLDIQFRRTDDNNCIIVRCDQAGSTIKLYSKAAGVETEKTGGTTAQTWTADTPYHIKIWFEGQQVRVFVDDVDRNTNAAVSFQTTAVQAKITLAVSNFESYPMTLSGAALTALEVITDRQAFTRQGEVLADSGAFEPFVIYETGPQIIADSGQSVYKMWYSKATTGICYAESSDGLTWQKYVSNPVINTHYRCSVIKVGATYYLYASPTDDTQIDLYTSSDGLSWTPDAGNPVIARPGAGWGSSKLANSYVWKEGANDWRMLLEGNGGIYNWSIAYYTSSDGISWAIQNAGNPVLSHTNGMVGGPWLKKDGSTYYLFVHSAVDGNAPTDIYRFTSTDLITWTQYPVGPVLWRYTDDEGRLINGQIADACIVEVGGTMYLFYDASENQATAGTFCIKLATAPTSVLTGDW
jgi:hypothetical protein